MSDLEKNIKRISIVHYIRLGYRAILFAAAFVLYIINRAEPDMTNYKMIWVIWFVFIVEMLFRLFPSKYESMGCQKQFGSNYLPDESANYSETTGGSGIAAVAVIWIILNALIGLVYLKGYIDSSVLVLISLAYSICDVICIMFFCPFQRWIMKNKCCVTCRIYNWDYAMMFTPLIFIHNFYSWSLVVFSVILLLRWELTAHMRGERFSEATNSNLKCENCMEKQCTLKYRKKRLMKNQQTKENTDSEVSKNLIL